MTHYATLGVDENATQDEIKKAYRKLASQHHPDKGGDTKKFQDIQSAYDAISDESKRQQYDHERRNPGMGHGGPHFTWHTTGGGPDLNDIFRQFGFGGNPFDHIHNVHRQQQPRRNKDLRIEIPLPLVTILEEQHKTLSVRTTTGHEEIVNVKIPRGVSTGTQIKYPNLGDNLFETLPRGDLIVQFTVHNAEGFMVNGVDLYTKLNVNCLKAVVGGEVELTGLNGNTFVLTIPPGSQPGTKFRIARQGLYELNSDRRGDLYAEMHVIIPQNFSPEQLETIRTLINTQ
jgi:DnaJ-class molecular chaperone